jgi:hypothetical protein
MPLWAKTATAVVVLLKTQPAELPHSQPAKIILKLKPIKNQHVTDQPQKSHSGTLPPSATF